MKKTISIQRILLVLGKGENDMTKKTEKKRHEEFRVVEVKKSQMTAQEHEYDELSKSAEGFLDCTIEQDEEELRIVYDVRHVKPLGSLRKDEKLRKIIVLSNLRELEKLHYQYAFSTNPDNLYYDTQGKVHVLHKDVISKDYSGKQDHFLEEYKSLIGYVLQNRYSYEDYLQGGQTLLRKDKFLKTILETKTIDELITVLEDYYEEQLEIKNSKNIEIKRSTNTRKNMYIVCSGILLVALTASLLYLYIYKIQEQKAMLTVYGNYLVEDYVAAIDASKEIQLVSMDSKQKYVLAVAYIKSEALTSEQKNNILSLLMPTGDEKRLDYWIQLGRGNVAEAENIAMQCADDELLLYSYLKEKQQLEANTELAGDEKSEKLSTLQGKIDSLAEQYTTEE